MLAFMKDQGLGDITTQNNSSTAVGDGAGKPQDQQYLTVATRQNHVRKSTYLLMAVFAVGLISLIFMIKQTSPQKALAGVEPAETKVEIAISKLTGIKTDMFDRMDQIVQKFYEFADFQQVKVNELVKDPFAADMFLLTPAGAGSEKIDMQDAAATLQRQVKLRAKKLKLRSIIKSDTRSCCMINDKIVYEGDSIKGFRVEKITQRTVVLVWEQSGHDNIQITMKLAE